MCQSPQRLSSTGCEGKSDSINKQTIPVPHHCRQIQLSHYFSLPHPHISNLLNQYGVVYFHTTCTEDPSIHLLKWRELALNTFKMNCFPTVSAVLTFFLIFSLLCIVICLDNSTYIWTDSGNLGNLKMEWDQTSSRISGSSTQAILLSLLGKK